MRSHRKPKGLKLFFTLRGSIVPRIVPKILFILVLSGVASVAYHLFPVTFPAYTTAPFALLGVALSLFLGFRNNAAYDRWWEARTLWGQLVVDARCLARQVDSFIDDSSAEGQKARQRLISLTIAFCHALRHQLHDSDSWEDIEKYIEPEDRRYLTEAGNIPDGLLQLMGRKLGRCRETLLSDFLMQGIDGHLSSMAEVQAGCERIKNTPLPIAYKLLVQRTTYLYCMILPLGLVASLQFATPLFCVIVAYAFFGLDALSDELEDPFEETINDLPIEEMAYSIEAGLLQKLPK
jgi:putative membrane protein